MSVVNHRGKGDSKERGDKGRGRGGGRTMGGREREGEGGVRTKGGRW